MRAGTQKVHHGAGFANPAGQDAFEIKKGQDRTTKTKRAALDLDSNPAGRKKSRVSA
jgi:hypothetical protein